MKCAGANNMDAQLAIAVLEWAKTPGNHGGNPYALKFVQMAEAMLCKVCQVREPIAGVYCQFCLDKETEDMTSDELF